MRFAVACLILVVAVGCGDRRPRSRDAIFAEKMSLDGVYLTKQSHKKVIAPKNRGIGPAFIDEETKEELWPAFECTNPDCPAHANPEKFLFTTFDRVGREESCPACAKIRNFKSESAVDKRRYRDYVRPYELPEVEKRVKELDDELERSYLADKKR